MLHDLLNNLRAWRRRERIRHEVSRLDPHLRADIGLPEMGDLGLRGNALFEARFGGRT